MANRTFDLYFTGKDDPRDCIVIGEDTKPIYIEFQTPNWQSTEARTTVYRDNREAVAFLDWTMGVHLGRVTMDNKQFPMSDMLQPGLTKGSRLFHYDGSPFEWRRSPDLNAYDLYFTPNIKIATFRRFAQHTPIGPSHGHLRYTFHDDRFLLRVLVSLCLNRWMEWHEM